MVQFKSSRRAPGRRSSHDSPGKLVDYAMKLAWQFRRGGKEYAKKNGLTFSQLRVLWYLDAKGEPAKMRDVADNFQITPRAATELVEGLVTRGHVARLDQEGDRRVVLVAITDTGAELLDIVAAARESQATTLLARLDESEQRTLFDLLEKLEGGEG